MSQTGQAPATNRISDLKVSGHLMTMEPGLFCVYHSPGAEPPSPSGFPGVRIVPAPGGAGNVSVVTIDSSGWMGGGNNAALIRVQDIPGQVLVTIYQEDGSAHEAPRLQVIRLGDVTPSAPVRGMRAAPQAIAPAAMKSQLPASTEVTAHIQQRGDVGSGIGEWMGTAGSHAWIEGFAISPKDFPAEDIEYQAVLGKGWLSPWTDGGNFCGSRGMALPILGLRVRLKGETAKTHICTIEATFTDGSSIGPVDENTAAEADSSAPLEAFCVKIVSRTGKSDTAKGKPSQAAVASDTAPAAEKKEKAREPAVSGKPVIKRATKPAGTGKKR